MTDEEKQPTEEPTAGSAPSPAQPETISEEATAGAHHIPAPTTVLMGREFPYPIYTVVFGILAVITLIELIIAEVFPDGWLSTALLVALSTAKAVLVVMFYMHLRDDPRIFTWTLVIPVFVALVSALFLLAVPEGY